ncbi:hypothetical protein CEE37_09235 [candidate division LCP-89 bacterium B3_LCP]|uniref:Uncharacterized protein n=1 Tax=candidate division LCP-89 bacterium B3_LCP TaxID=2012998 RepID=A0A532UZU5_UNCL8|nr:MAG: hypothetical protein CEE37_09235 [candidate division LCP-89 bacterium B3_LCP]
MSNQYLNDAGDIDWSKLTIDLNIEKIMKRYANADKVRKWRKMNLPQQFDSLIELYVHEYEPKRSFILRLENWIIYGYRYGAGKRFSCRSVCADDSSGQPEGKKEVSIKFPDLSKFLVHDSH